MFENASIDTGLMLAVILTLAAAWFALNRAAARRRDARFALLAQLFGAQVAREGEWISRFHTVIGGRDADVCDEHSSQGPPAEVPSADGWTLVTTMPLKRREWASHRIEVCRAEARALGSTLPRVASGDAGFDRAFAIHETAGDVAVNWEESSLRRAITDFYALQVPVSALVVEGGKLVHRIPPSAPAINAQELRSLLEAQAKVAAALDLVVAERVSEEA